MTHPQFIILVLQAIADGIIGDGLSIVGDEYANSQGETYNEIFEKICA